MCSTRSLSIRSLTPFLAKSIHDLSEKPSPPCLVLFFPTLLAFSAEEGHFREPARADSLTHVRGHLCSRCTGAWELPLISLPP